MNFLVFSNTAKRLQTELYGHEGTDVLPVAVDIDGRLVLSSSGAVTVTATDLDIRALSWGTDSVAVTATDLDIRNLTGTTDSVSIAAMAFSATSWTGTLPSGTNYLQSIDISPYSQNSFFIRNTGTTSFTVTAQVAPEDVDSSYLSVGSAQAVSGSSNAIAPITVAMQYARLMVQSSGTITYSAWYNARA